MRKFNNDLPNIKFTFELEKNGEINFLGILIKRLNTNKLETGIYQKSTVADIYQLTCTCTNRIENRDNFIE